MSDRALELLTSIDNSLKRLLALSTARAHTHGAGAPGGGAVASDRDLDGQYGNPDIRADPKDWTGPSFKKRPMKECPAEFLDLYAEMKDYFGRKADENGDTTDKGVPKSKYEFLDAARARGWAARIRSGRHTPPPTAAAPSAGWAGDSAGGGWGAAPDTTSPAPDEDDIPF